MSHWLKLLTNHQHSAVRLSFHYSFTSLSTLKPVLVREMFFPLSYEQSFFVLYTVETIFVVMVTILVITVGVFFIFHLHGRESLSSSGCCF